MSSNPALGEVYSIHHYVIKFISDLQQSVGSSVSSTNKTDHHDTTEILLKVALNTVALTLTLDCHICVWSGLVGSYCSFCSALSTRPLWVSYLSFLCWSCMVCPSTCLRLLSIPFWYLQTFLRQQMELFAALSNLHCNKKDNLFDIAK